MGELFETPEITNPESSESDVLDNKNNLNVVDAENNMNDDYQTLISRILDISNKYTYDNSENNEELIRQLENEFEKLGYGDLFKLEKANLSNYINNLGHPLGGKDINNFFDNKASRKFAFYYNIKKARTLGAWDDSYNYVITDLLDKDKDWATKALSDKEIHEKITQWVDALDQYKKETLEDINNKKILLINTVDILFDQDYSNTEELHKTVCDKLVELDLEILEEDMNLIFKSSKNNIDEYKSLVYDFLNGDYFDKAFILHKFENIEDDKEDEIDAKEDEEESKKDEKDEEEETALMQEFLEDKESLDITQDGKIDNDDIKAYKQEMKTRIEELRDIITNEIQGEIKATREDKKNLRNGKKEIRNEIKEMKKKLQELRKDAKNNKEEIKEQRERIKQKRGNLENLKKECNKKRKEYTNQIDRNRKKRREYRKLIQQYKKEGRETIVEIKQEKRQEDREKRQEDREKRQEDREKRQENREKRQRKQERLEGSKQFISEILNQITNIEYNSLEDLKEKILAVCRQEKVNLNNNHVKSLIYLACDDSIKRNNASDSYIVFYALACGIDIATQQDLQDFVATVKSNGRDGRYAQQYKNFLSNIGQHYNEGVNEVAKQSLIAKYEETTIPYIKRNFSESDFIEFAYKADNQQYQSGLKVASNIDNVSDKLNNYSFRPTKTRHEEAVLKYTAFNITFKNISTLNDSIFKKLEALHINLRDDLFKYGIYSQTDNYFNESAWNKYVATKLEPLGLATEETGQLGSAMAGLHDIVKKNYEILSSNFDADQENFEKIAKIYALGEIIDNIKNLFTNENILSENLGSGTNLGFEFNEDSADIVGDCLILKGKANGTEATIKYDLRTGKLYMNSFMQQEFNPPKITIGNNEPNTEIGNIGNFDDLLDGYKHMSSNRGRNMKHRRPYDNNRSSHSTNKKNFREIDDDYINAKILKRLMRNKLLGKLSEIGKIVKEKAGEQSMENNVIDDFLKTFNILPDGGNSSTIEFLGGSNLYILLEAIKNTDNEDHLLKFSNFMNELMGICGLNRGKNNLHSKEHETDSVTIFDIDEKNATQDIISLQKANQSFFSEGNGEKDKIKSCESHFDASVQLSFANIIVQKCCIRSEGSRKISDNLTEEFVNSIKEGIETIKHDENDVLAMGNLLEDDSIRTS